MTAAQTDQVVELLSEARRFQERAVSLAREVPDTWGVKVALLAQQRAALGKIDEAKRVLVS